MFNTNPVHSWPNTMFDPSEVSTMSKLALQVTCHGPGLVKIQKIPLLEITNDTVEDEKDPEPFIEPIDEHRAYLVNGMLKVSLKFPGDFISINRHSDNIRLYISLRRFKIVMDLNFQVVPIWDSTQWSPDLFHSREPAEFMIYHPTWEKEYLAGMLRCHNTTTMKSIAQFIENIAYE